MSAIICVDQIRSEPSWLEGQYCMDCNTKFNISHRKHHWYVFITHQITFCNAMVIYFYSIVVTVVDYYATSVLPSKCQLLSLILINQSECVKCAQTLSN